MKAESAAKDFPVVCVGGSAGGLDAYTRRSGDDTFSSLDTSPAIRLRSTFSWSIATRVTPEKLSKVLMSRSIRIVPSYISRMQLLSKSAF